MNRSADKILTFRGQMKDRSVEAKGQVRKSDRLHPLVKRRRIFWLSIMSLFVIWFLFELTVQQIRIWDQEEKLLAKQGELRVVQAETKQLKDQVRDLHSPQYLLELAHRLGYSKQGEQNYKVPKD
ncbi:Cell division protein FtsB [Seinonella peptonophila]|uniref:Cell division protein FtsB n=1 Tax=Seinonella peptonophila TaxID=112248 RepID=A0A1M4YRM7_9BACL|nr:septum formation initiator family protein [Seinonella peptonophila]SHF08454.1 Cell division protein FtsB [Seinonella peptonophila]